MIQRTLVLVKPDGVRRSLVGDVIQRFEKVGLKIAALKMAWVDEDFSKKHYTDDITKRRGERVRNSLVQYLKEGPIVAIVLEGIESIETVRKIVGSTEPKVAQPGTIRGDYCHVSFNYADDKKIAVKNIIHASSDPEDAEREIHLWFSDDEMFEYKLNHDNDIRE